MKKTIIAVVAALALTAIAHAENWIMVMESKDGPRLLVDVDSFGGKQWPDLTDASKSNVWLFAKFMYYNNESGAGEPFVFTTKFDTCKTGNGELVYQAWDGKNFANKGRYWWSADGQKMYDAGGLALCALAKGAVAPDKQKQGTKGKDSV